MHAHYHGLTSSGVHICIFINVGIHKTIDVQSIRLVICVRRKWPILLMELHLEE